MVTLWHVTPCSLVRVYQHFGRWIAFHLRLNELHSSDLIMGSTISPETWVNLYQASRCHFPNTAPPPNTRHQHLVPSKLTTAPSICASCNHIQSSYSWAHGSAHSRQTNLAHLNYSCLQNCHRNDITECSWLFFFFKDLLHSKSVRYTGLQKKIRNCSFNQFALVVPRRASDRECTVLGSYEYSSEKQVQRKNTAAVR